MKSGYDQFFIKAKQASVNKPADIENNFEVKRQFKSRPKKKKRPFPVKSFALFGVITLSMILALENSEQISQYFGKIDISFSTASAETSKKEDSVKKEENTEVTSKIVSDKSETMTKEVKAEDSDYLFKLSERKKELDAREDSLNKQAEEIAKQKQEIELKLKQLEDYREKISTLLKDRMTSDSKKIETLVQVYTNMKPAQAAKIFETMDEDLVIEILSRMKKKNAADVLNLVNANKAQVLSEKFTGYRAPASLPSVNKNKAEEAETINEGGK